LETLIATSVLGLLCLAAEIFNGRKILAPLVILGLLAILVWNALAWNTNISYYNDMFRFDNFAVAFSGLLILFSVFIVVLGLDFYKEQPSHWSDYLSIFLFTLCGAVILTGYNNLVMLFLGIEILSISLYIMAGSNKRDLSSNEAGMKYFLMGSFASGILLFGIALIYGASGSFNLQEIQAASLHNPAHPMLISGVLLLMIGLFFKVSAAPFHFWSPDVYQGSPALVTAFMASVAKISAMAAFYRLAAIGLPSLMPQLEMVFMIVVALTICTGNILAMVQDNFKRMLAFSGISHAGYMLLALLSASLADSEILLYYAFAYGAANIAAFGVAITVFKFMKNENADAFRGLIKKQPLLAVCLIMALLSMASMPPLAGFWAKYFVFSAAIGKGYLPLVVIGIINSLFGVYYYFKIIAAMLLKPSDETAVTPPLSYVIVIVLCTLIVVALGIVPDVILSLL